MEASKAIDSFDKVPDKGPITQFGTSSNHTRLN